MKCIGCTKPWIYKIIIFLLTMLNYDIAVVGCGFVGTHLAKYLSKFYSIRTFDINPQSENMKRYNIPHKICDIRDKKDISKKLENPSIVIHTVATDVLKTDENKRLSYEINILGTQNVCEVVANHSNIRGLILTSSWHVFGEQELHGTINESFGYRPDKVEYRARLYALSKISQECIIRFFDEMFPKKYFGAIRLGTVLAEDMKDEIAVNLFINQALNGKEITPYKHSMHRPMLFITINDVCKAFKSFVEVIFSKEKTQTSSIEHIINLAHPNPMSILDVAEMIKRSIEKHSNGKIIPIVSIVDKNLPQFFDVEDKNRINFDITKIHNFLKIDKLIEPKMFIDNLIKKRISELSK